MKRFLAIYSGTQASLDRAGWPGMDDATRKAKQAAGVAAWMEWGRRHANAIVEVGSPLGKTKKVSREVIADIRNAMTGYVIVQADSHEAAARMFENHPHFTLLPGDAVEIMECLPLPAAVTAR